MHTHTNTHTQVAFKSDYLRVFQAQQLSAAELLVAKEALAEARQVRALSLFVCILFTCVHFENFLCAGREWKLGMRELAIFRII